MMNKKLEVTKRTKVKRLPKRADYERETINDILDEAYLCHVGFTVDGSPFVIPTLYARDGDKLLLHGSAASRMLKNLAQGIDVCVTVTLVDGLVLARSAFHHSMNYRSVVIFGQARLIEEESEKYEALRLFTDHIIPNRWPEIRWPNAKELKGTLVLSLPITEASAKIRTGGPVDDEEDYERSVWAGVLPLSTSAGEPINDSRLKERITVPPHVTEYKRG